MAVIQAASCWKLAGSAPAEVGGADVSCIQHGPAFRLVTNARASAWLYLLTNNAGTRDCPTGRVSQLVEKTSLRYSLRSTDLAHPGGGDGAGRLGRHRLRRRLLLLLLGLLLLLLQADHMTSTEH